MRVGLVGLGNLGTAVGNMISENGYEVLGWEFHQEVVEEINQNHLNSRFLPGVSLHESLLATTDIAEIFQSCQVIFVAIPSAFIQSTLNPFQKKVTSDVVFVNMAKGIDGRSGLTSFQILSSIFPDNPCIMLSGPSIANEFARHLPTSVMVAGRSRHDLLLVSRILDNDYFRTRFSQDSIGVELGGILKNIYAIGLGLFDGKNITSINFRAVYLTIAVEEIARIGVGMGAEVETFLYLAGIGDLLATSLSPHSHNRHMGELLAKGLSGQQIRNEMGVLPEGYNTLEAILYLAEKLHISIPLAHGLWDVIQGRYTADQFIYSFIKDFVEK
jgi:glycerol-3-phosphate dehydrogenase (NAD(P)+)